VVRSLVVTQNVTADGVVDATGNWFGPSGSDDAADVAELLEVQRGHWEAADALLLGRGTFEAFRSYWPARTDDVTGVSAYLDAVDKYVVSSTLSEGELGWPGSHLLGGPLAGEVTRLKAAPGKDIVVTGSISVTHALTAAGLVDEYRLFVYPVVLGSGRRLFADGTARQPLRHVESRGFRAGIQLVRYRTAGGAA
jgi:dihydrofolate reductase